MSRRSILIVFFAALALRLVYLGLVYDGPDSLRMEDPGLYERRAGWFLIAGAAINPFTPSIIAAPKIRAMDRPDFYDTQGETVVERIWLLLSGTRNPPFTALAVLAVLLTVILRGAEFAAMARIGRTVATGGPAPPGGRRLHPGRDRTDCRGQIPIAGVKYRLPGSNTDCLSSQL